MTVLKLIQDLKDKFEVATLQIENYTKDDYKVFAVGCTDAGALDLLYVVGNSEKHAFFHITYGVYKKYETLEETNEFFNMLIKDFGPENINDISDILEANYLHPDVFITDILTY